MAIFEIQWKVSAEKEIRRIDRKEILRLIKAIDGLEMNPFPHFVRKLQGSESSYRIPIGDYRVVYQVDVKKHVVTIHHVRHRKDVYR
jgi:mRNA interferase RelE/StbE